MIADGTDGFGVLFLFIGPGVLVDFQLGPIEGHETYNYSGEEKKVDARDGRIKVDAERKGLIEAWIGLVIYIMATQIETGEETRKCH